MLVADDERDIVELVAIVLGRAGYDVITAPDGERALQLVRERLPDLCVLDGRMPGLAGYEILRRLRGDERGVKVLILTATIDDEREIRRHGVASGVHEEAVRGGGAARRGRAAAQIVDVEVELLWWAG